MQAMKLRELRAEVAATTARPGLVLLPPGRPATDPGAGAAQARVDHALGRTLDEFLDRAGFVEVAAPPDAGLATQLGRTCWRRRDGILTGQWEAAAGTLLVDLLERALLAALHGTLNRAYDDLGRLGVDRDRLKYLRLPLKRLRAAVPSRLANGHAAAGWSGLGPAEQALLAEAGEPILLLLLAPAARDAELPVARVERARLLLPGVGCVATTGAGGRFTLDLPALLRFLCARQVAYRARP